MLLKNTKSELAKPRAELQPETLELDRNLDGKLILYQDEQDDLPVQIHRCFPWTAPARFISLRDKDDNELILLPDLENLKTETRSALEQALTDAGFVMEITRIDRLEEEYELRNWKVKTRQGMRTFQMKVDDWPRELPGGSLLIQDVAGDLFLIRDPKTLDKKSLKLLWGYLN